MCFVSNTCSIYTDRKTVHQKILASGATCWFSAPNPLELPYPFLVLLLQSLDTGWTISLHASLIKGHSYGHRSNRRCQRKTLSYLPAHSEACYSVDGNPTHHSHVNPSHILHFTRHFHLLEDGTYLDCWPVPKWHQKRAGLGWPASQGSIMNTRCCTHKVTVTKFPWKYLPIGMAVVLVSSKAWCSRSCIPLVKAHG